MFQRSRKVAAMLLLMFAAANVLALTCVAAGPASMSESMANCDMDMPADAGTTIGSYGNCCLSCVVDAGLLDTDGFWAPSGVAVALPVVRGIQQVSLPATRQLSADGVLPEVSPPVFLLNSSLLI